MLTLWMLYAICPVRRVFAVVGLATERALAGWALPRRWAWIVAMLASVVLPLRGLEAPATPVRVQAAMAGIRQADAGRRSRARTATPAAGVLVRVGRAGRRFDPWARDAWIAATGVLLLALAHSGRRLARRSAAWRSGRLRRRDGAHRTRRRAGRGRHPASARGRAGMGARARRRRTVALAATRARASRGTRPWRPFSSRRCCSSCSPGMPCSGWMAARLRLAVEIDCDARVLRATRRATRVRIAAPRRRRAALAPTFPVRLARRAAVPTRTEDFTPCPSCALVIRSSPRCPLPASPSPRAWRPSATPLPSSATAGARDRRNPSSRQKRA